MATVQGLEIDGRSGAPSAADIEVTMKGGQVQIKIVNPASGKLWPQWFLISGDQWRELNADAAGS